MFRWNIFSDERCSAKAQGIKGEAFGRFPQESEKLTIENGKLKIVSFQFVSIG